MIPRYRSKDVAFREKQLAPLAFWIMKLRKNRQTKVTSNDSATTNQLHDIVDAADLIIKQSHRDPNYLLRFVADHFGGGNIKTLHHVKPILFQKCKNSSLFSSSLSSIPELHHVSLLNRFDPDVVSSNRRKIQDLCFEEFMSQKNYQQRREGEEEEEEEDDEELRVISQKNLISWYSSRISRPEPHSKQNLQQEVSLVEHARWVCQQVKLPNNDVKNGNSNNVSSSSSFWRPKCIVDVGGGNGYLCFLAQQRLLPSGEVIVVDFEKPPYSIDDDQMFGKSEVNFGKNPYFRRIVKSIEQVNWWQDVRYKPEDVLVISKHLCGGGVDELLRTFRLQGFYPRALCLSSCCHFKRLNTESYINPSFIRDLLLDKKEPWIQKLFEKGKQLELAEFLVPITEKLRQHRLRDPCIELDADGDENQSMDNNVATNKKHAEDSQRERDWRMQKKMVTEISRHHQFSEQNLLEHSRKRQESRVERARQRIGAMLQVFKDDLEKRISTSSNSPDLTVENEQKLIDRGGAVSSSCSCDDPPPLPQLPEHGRSQQKEGLRNLFSAISSRTNWVGTHNKDEIWMQRCGRDLESVLDAGRVEFLRNGANFPYLESPYCAEQVSFVPADVSPRNRVLLGWRKMKGDGHYLTV